MKDPWPSLWKSMWDLTRQGIEPMSPALAGRFFTTESPGKLPEDSCIVIEVRVNGTLQHRGCKTGGEKYFKVSDNRSSFRIGKKKVDNYTQANRRVELVLNELGKAACITDLRGKEFSFGSAILYIHPDVWERSLGWREIFGCNQHINDIYSHETLWDSLKSEYRLERNPRTDLVCSRINNSGWKERNSKGDWEKKLQVR